MRRITHLATLRGQANKLRLKLDKGQAIEQTFEILGEDEPWEDTPGHTVHVIGGKNPGTYTVDENGERHWIRKESA